MERVQQNITVVVFGGFHRRLPDGYFRWHHRPPFWVSTPALRTADSWVDTWFYFWVVLSVWMTHADTLQKSAIPLFILISLQVSEWVYGRIKFGQLTGYHAYMAKLWGLSLFAAIFSVMLFNYDGFIWWTAIILGWVSSIENWLLTLTLSTWTMDVKSIFHVWRSIKA